jgi:surface protein
MSILYMLSLIKKTRRLKTMKNKTRTSKNGGARASYKYKSKSKPTTNTSIKDLPEDVMKYSMGFIRHALDDRSIRKAVKDYIEGGPKKKAVIEKYGKIENWDTSRVTDMSSLFASEFTGINFEDISKFNEDISKWDVSNVTAMEDMFSGAESFNQPIGKWDVSKVTTMNFMFCGAESFNQPIGDWDVSNVTNMSYMFDEAVKFNRPINKWDVSNVTNMKSMFAGAINFKKRLTTWGNKLPRNANLRYIFSSMTAGIVKKIAPWYYKRIGY